MFCLLPGTDLRSSSLPVGTSASGGRTGTGHPVAFGSNSSSGTSTSSVVLTTSSGCVRSSSRVRATTGAVAELVAVAALDLAPILGLRTVLGEVAVVVTVATGDVVLYIYQHGSKQFLWKQAYHVGRLRAIATSVSRLSAVAADDNTLVGAVGLSVTFFLAVAALVCGL